MKTCLTCGIYKFPNETLTCPKCGEGSWGNPEPEEPEDAAEPEVPADDQDLIETKPDAKSARKRR